MKEAVIGIIVLIVLILFVYTMTWTAKTLSYKWWYEDKVQETVEEILLEKGLIKND